MRAGLRRLEPGIIQADSVKDQQIIRFEVQFLDGSKVRGLAAVTRTHLGQHLGEDRAEFDNPSYLR